VIKPWPALATDTLSASRTGTPPDRPDLANRFPGLHPGRRPRRLGHGHPGGDISGDRGQFRVDTRGERPAHPQVKFVLAQPTVYERGLEHLDHLLAVGVQRPQTAAVRSCHLISRPGHHQRLPTIAMQEG